MSLKFNNLLYTYYTPGYSWRGAGEPTYWEDFFYRFSIISYFLSPILNIALCWLIIIEYKNYKDTNKYEQQYISNNLYLMAVLMINLNLLLFTISFYFIYNAVLIVIYVIMLILPIIGMISCIQCINETRNKEKFINIYNMSLTVLIFNLMIIIFNIVEIILNYKNIKK